MTTLPLSVELREALITACGQAFYYKSGPRAVFVNAGVPGDIFDGLKDQEASKFVICRTILQYLDAQGQAGRKSQHAIATELAAVKAPMPDADARQGQAALDQLRALMPKSSASASDEAASAVAARRERAELTAATRRADAAKMAALCQQFMALSKVTPGQTAQQRGFGFEKFLQSLFEVDHIPFRGSYRVGSVEQIDGAFKLDSKDYLVEAKWRKDPPGVNDLYAFAHKVEGKIDGTRGLFLTMTPPASDTIAQLARVTKRLLIMDAQDLAVVIQGLMPLREALQLKADKAAHEGAAFFRLGQSSAVR